MVTRGKHYYDIAKEGSLSVGDHPGLKYLRDLCHNADTILDYGCGEGSRLNILLPENKTGYGVDINDYAVKEAKNNYPRHHFQTYDGRKLPFPNQKFDLVYSAFVLEHTDDPEGYLLEAIRVLKSGGLFVILCPNFGAPNRRSPNSIERPVSKLIKGFLADFSHLNELHFTKVKPKETYHDIDDDTAVEPYLLNLNNFLQNHSLKTIRSSSLWELEAASINLRKLLFMFLGRLGLSPFKYWGPQIFLVVKKPD